LQLNLYLLFFLNKKFSFINQFIFIFWNNFWIEVFLIQVLFVYFFLKFLTENNLYKLCFLVMFFITLSCIYLGLLQLEIFSAFLFISEFIILIFYFCFFFKLNLYNQFIFLKSFKNFYINLLLVILIPILLYIFNFFFSFILLDDCFLSYYNAYKLFNNFVMNDLSFFFYSFFQFYTILFALIGVLLLLMTCYLIYVIWVYFFIKEIDTYFINQLNLSSKDNKVWKKNKINFFNFKE